jgi:predicted PurR-regulated permease PerM
MATKTPSLNDAKPLAEETPSNSAEVTAVPMPAEDVELLQSSIRLGSLAQIVVAVIAFLGLIYILKLVMVTTLASLLLAFVLEPLVIQLRRLRVPRSMAALVAVTLLIAVSVGLTYFFYSRAVDFATQLPRYSGRIRESVSQLRKQTSKLEESTQTVMGAPNDGKKPVQVEIHESPGLKNMIANGSGALGDALLGLTFAPFLIYFMLTWKDHAHASTVRLFPKEHRLAAHRTIGKISEMIRSYIVGNFFVGLLNAVVSGLVFWYLNIPYFYFLGVLSGFVSLIPYLGVFLALFPPIAAGIGVLNKTGLLIIFATVIGLHVISMNVLFPKIVGRRLRLNPLAVTLSLLFWAWIWGSMGLILAVPLVGATKIVCDHMESLQGLGAWLGE